jgi:hypothetical protein
MSEPEEGAGGPHLFLRAVPVLVEPALELVREVLGPDGGERTETTGGLDVADDTDDHHGRGLDDGDGLNDLTLVHLCREERKRRERKGGQPAEASLEVAHR